MMSTCVKSFKGATPKDFQELVGGNNNILNLFEVTPTNIINRGAFQPCIQENQWIFWYHIRVNDCIHYPLMNSGETSIAGDTVRNPALFDMVANETIEVPIWRQKWL